MGADKIQISQKLRWKQTNDEKDEWVCSCDMYSCV